jgi:hypothetical protein
MSHDVLFSSRDPQPGALPDLSVVALREPVPAADRTLPAGAEGTVVGTWAGGEAYVVEFAEPFHAVITVDAKLLREISRLAD